MKKNASIIVFTILIATQSFAQLCGMPDDSPPDETLSGSCSTSSIWNTNAAYIPIDQDITALTVKVNFIFWQRGDGIIGNFQENNPNHNFYLDEVISEMNRRVSNLVDPQDAGCYSGLPDYLKDARIKYDVKKYYIEDGYLWDIENATSSFAFCPDTWSQTYTDLAYQRLEEHNVRDGIDVFFSNEGSSFQNLIIDNFDDYTVVNNYDCSESPGFQSNLSKRLRVAMTNEYLKYEFRGNIAPQGTFWY